MADAAWLPPALPDGVTGWAGYLQNIHPGGALHPWPAQDWARASQMLRNVGGGFLVPIYLPGGGEDPREAARSAVGQCVALGQPHGTLIVLDREENRGDLDATWCWAWHDAIVGQGFIPGGYTSASTASVFLGWSIRWIAREGAETVAPLDQLTQYALTVPGGGGSVDLSWVADSVPAWPVVVSSPGGSGHGPVLEETLYAAEVWNDGAAEWLYSGNTLVHLGTVAEGSELAAPQNVAPFNAPALPYRRVDPALTAALPKVGQ